MITSLVQQEIILQPQIVYLSIVLFKSIIKAYLRALPFMQSLIKGMNAIFNKRKETQALALNSVAK